MGSTMEGTVAWHQRPCMKTDTHWQGTAVLPISLTLHPLRTDPNQCGCGIAMTECTVVYGYSCFFPPRDNFSLCYKHLFPISYQSPVPRFISPSLTGRQLQSPISQGRTGLRTGYKLPQRCRACACHAILRAKPRGRRGGNSRRARRGVLGERHLLTLQ